MKTLVVVSHKKDWPLEVPGVEIVTAREYLTQPHWAKERRARVVNLCRQYRYQSLGYYVSLLAEARGHRALPSVMTLQDLRNSPMLQIAADELDELIHRSLKPITSDRFVLSVYFGRNLANRHSELAAALFRHFPAPLLSALFVQDGAGEWTLKKLTVMPASAIPEEHRAFAIEAAKSWFKGRSRLIQKRSAPRFDLAILTDDGDETRPSNEAALKKFEKAAAQLEIATERIGRTDFARLSEFDGLFIRVTTAVNHYSYRFARRAEAEGLVVMDDPLSILRCTNKVYLAEMLERAKLPSPKTRIIGKENLAQMGEEIGFPIILKRPDSSTSLGVVKVDNAGQLAEVTATLLESSDLLIAQEFLPTEYDWRIGLLEGEPLFAVKYFMAPGHWQIVNHAARSKGTKYGDSKCFPLSEVPAEVLRLATEAAGLIGNGLYGVDVKESGGKWYVIEVNDNPSLDRGVEDDFLGDKLYEKVMSVFLRRMESRREGKGR